MPDRSVTLRILGDDGDVLNKLRVVNAEIDKLESRNPITLNITANIDLALAGIEAVKTALDGLVDKVVTVGIRYVPLGGAPDVGGVQVGVSTGGGGGGSSGLIGPDPSTLALIGTTETLTEATDRLATTTTDLNVTTIPLVPATLQLVNITGDLVEATRNLTAMTGGEKAAGGNGGGDGGAGALAAATGVQTISDAEAAKSEWFLATAELMRAKAANIAAKATEDNAAATVTATAVWNSAGGALGFLGGKLALFGGAFGKIPILGVVSGFHILTETAIEFAGTLIPATIALVGFGVAAAPVVQDLVSRMTALYDVTDAYNAKIYPLTGQFGEMAAAVKPEVYVLFGEALDVINAKTGLFINAAKATGAVLDQLGARFTYAVTHGTALQTFLHNGAIDLQGWGNLIGNIGGIIGNVLKVLPGYAGDLLNVLNAVSHGLETISGSEVGQKIIGIGLAFHGAVFYIGLLSTGVALLIRSGLGLVSSMAGAAANSLAGMGVAGTRAATALTGLQVEIAGLSLGTIAVFAAMAIAVGFVAYQMFHAKDAAESMTASIQTSLGNLPLNQLQQGVANAIGEATTQFDSLKNTVIGNTVSMDQFKFGVIKSDSVIGELVTHMQDIAAAGGPVSGLAGIFVKVAHAVGLVQTPAQDAQSALSLFDSDQQKYNQHMQEASTVFHGTASAMMALNGAGITSAQVIGDNTQQWAEALIEAQGYENALKAATQTSGRYGAAENALNFSLFDTANQLGYNYDTLQKVTQAEDSLLNTLLAGEQAFIGFQQSVNGIGTDAKAAGASLSGLNANSLTLASDYYNNLIPGLQKTIDAMQMQQANTTDLTQVTATGSKEILKYAGNNVLARTTVVDLINNALGPGTVSLQTLNGWVDKNSTTLGGMQQAISKTTIQASAFANVLGSDVNQMIAASIVQAYGGQQAFNAFSSGILKNQTDNGTWYKSAQNVVAILEKQSGNNLPAARNAFIQYAVNGLDLSTKSAEQLWTMLTSKTTPSVNALSTAVSRIPKAEYPVIYMTGTGKYTISGVDALTGTTNTGGILPTPTGHAKGYRVPGFGGGDRHLALLEGGETVVPKELTPSVAGLMSAHGVPGFTSGAYVASGPSGVAGLGGFASGMYNTFNSDMTSAMVSAMKSGMQQAMQAFSVPNVGSGVSRWTGLVDEALRMLGLPLSLAARVLYQMSTESGGNPNAINLTDSNAAAGDPSRGLMQTIASTFDEYHVAGTSWNIYDPLANIAAAINYALHVYGPSLMSGGMGIGSGHGYANGGMITEPIFGMGLSGQRYSFGEVGPEMVTPLTGPRAQLGGGGGNIYITVNAGDAIDPQAVAQAIHQKLRRYKQLKGNQALGLD